MFTAGVLFVVAAGWFVANNKYEETKMWRYRRMRASFAWSMVGASVGSFFGIAGFGDAIAGTIPGAIFGYVLASNFMKKDGNPNL